VYSLPKISAVSHPLRVRGLKPPPAVPSAGPRIVAPLAGAWIETSVLLPCSVVIVVAPLAGAWIETVKNSRRRCLPPVAPLAGAWIETTEPTSNITEAWSRTPCGCVD